MLAEEEEAEGRSDERNRKSRHDGHRWTQKFGLNRCTTNQRCLRAECEKWFGHQRVCPLTEAASCLTVTAGRCARSVLQTGSKDGYVCVSLCCIRHKHRLPCPRTEDVVLNFSLTQVKHTIVQLLQSWQERKFSFRWRRATFDVAQLTA